MPNYTFDHVHHETTDTSAAVDFYKRVLGATAGEPFARGDATWVEVHIGSVQITVTDREFTPMELGRYQGLDHFALVTDDFDATLAHMEQEGVHIWFGPVQIPDTGRRIFFIDGPDSVKIELMEKV
jgi:predicted enzyme related to lactoylglutathione lyase